MASVASGGAGSAPAGGGGAGTAPAGGGGAGSAPASISPIDVFAEVTFYSPEGIELFVNILGNLSEGDSSKPNSYYTLDEEAGEGSCRLTDPGILYHYTLTEMDVDDHAAESGHAFHIDFFEEQENIIGHIEASISESTMKLELIRTDFRSKEERNRGNFRKYAEQKFGARFLAAFEDIAKRGGIQTLELMAVPGVNTFYEKYGYVKTGKPTKTNMGNMHSMTKTVKRKRSRRTRRKR